jgi:hypothetical protein|nr:MAG TPA: hypothetical protein [Caudoviricetes sp.]
MRKKDILKDAKEILEMLPDASESDKYYFNFEINNTLKRFANRLYIYPSITLLIKKEDKIISYIYTNSGERDYDKKVDEMKNEIIGCKSLNNIMK